MACPFHREWPFFEVGRAHFNLFRNKCDYSHFVFVSNAYSMEFSADQVMQPINANALSSWVENIPANMVDKIAELAPMLRTLGYNSDSQIANYTFAENDGLNALNTTQRESWLSKALTVLQ